MAPVLAYWGIRGLAQPIRLLLEYTGTEFQDKMFESGPAPRYDKSCWLDVKNDFGLDFPNLPYYIDGDVKISQSSAILRFVARKHDLCGKTEAEKVRVDILENQAMDFRNSWVRLCYLDFTTHNQSIDQSIISNRPNTPWWTPEIRDLHRATRRSLSIYRRHATDANHVTYKKNRSQLRRLIKIGKEEYGTSSVDGKVLGQEGNTANQKQKYLEALPETIKMFSKFLGNNTWFAGENVTFMDFVMYELIDQHLQLEPSMLKNAKNLADFQKRFEVLEPIKNYMASDRFMKAPINDKMAKFGAAK